MDLSAAASIATDTTGKRGHTKKKEQAASFDAKSANTAAAAATAAAASEFVPCSAATSAYDSSWGIASACDNAMDDGTFAPGFAAPAISPLQQQPAAAADDWRFSAAHFGGGGFESPTAATRSPGGWLGPTAACSRSRAKRSGGRSRAPLPAAAGGLRPARPALTRRGSRPPLLPAEWSLMRAAALIDSESDSDSDSTASGLESAAAQAPPAAAAAASTQSAARRGSNSGSSSGGSSGQGHRHSDANGARGRGSTAAAVDDDVDIDELVRQLDEAERIKNSKERNSGTSNRRNAEEDHHTARYKTDSSGLEADVALEEEASADGNVPRDWGTLVAGPQVPVMAPGSERCHACLTPWDQMQGALQLAVIPSESEECGHVVCVGCVAGQHKSATKGAKDEQITSTCPLGRKERPWGIIKDITRVYMQSEDVAWIVDMAKSLQQRHMCNDPKALVKQLLYNKRYYMYNGAYAIGPRSCCLTYHSLTQQPLPEAWCKLSVLPPWFSIVEVGLTICNLMDMALADPRMMELKSDHKQRIYEDARRPTQEMRHELMPTERELNSTRLTSDQRAEKIAQCERLRAELVSKRRDAAENIFYQLNAVGRMGAVVVTAGQVDAAHIDLHGLSFQQAMERINEDILPCFPALRSVVLIPGQGRHSATGEPTLRDKLLKELVGLGYACRVVTKNKGQLLLQPKSS
ncbi:hypothetical protein JKP88DRAFT_265204 [Tribonema minus]|uniref:RING-type domain-containing protein n=1 Tax=Tribonema minus TaxID=303371 RepID=A0A835YU04_9STRA|nr:hypothetical protein JKP88DRAFT_265204 [Tribonema minus]